MSVFLGKFGHVYRTPTIDYNKGIGARTLHKDAEKAGIGIPSYTKPGYVASYISERWEYSSQTIRNASHIRLKEIYLGYDIPKSLLKKIKIKQLKVYVQMKRYRTCLGS